MNFLKRGLISIVRTPVKSCILLLLIFILGGVVSGSVSIRHAIHTTDLNLRKNMRPVVVFTEDWHALHEVWEQEGGHLYDLLDQSLLYEVGQLSYVEYFDYSMWFQLASLELGVWYPNSREELIPLIGIVDPELGQVFQVGGVSHSEFIDIRQGFVEIVEGETFTEEQLTSGSHVTVVSQAFARHNSLNVGDTVNFNSIGIYEDKFVLLGDYEFEIIGLFDVIDFDIESFESVVDWTLPELRMFNIINQIYLPNNVVRELNESFNYQDAMNSEYLGAEIDWENFEHFYRMNPIFVLYDPLYLSDFSEAAQSILRGVWYLSDGTNRFAPISSSMDMMRGIADGILLGVSIATILILGLIITLFLHDRRHEVGIYLALGEKKGKILGQILTEIAIVTTIAITISLFAGAFIANHLSQELLHNELASFEAPTRELFGTEVVEPWEIMGFPPPMSGEEMLEFYDFSVTGGTVAIFYGISLVIVFFSTTIPIIYLTYLDPKKVLL